MKSVICLKFLSGIFRNSISDFFTKLMNTVSKFPKITSEIPPNLFPKLLKESSVSQEYAIIVPYNFLGFLPRIRSGLF